MSNATTEVRTAAPITITLDVADLAKHLVPDYDAPYSEDGPEPMGALDGILGHVANLVAADLRKEYVRAAADRAKDDVSAEVRGIVQSVLADGAVVGDGYSAKKVAPLRDLIRDEVEAWTTNKVSDGYGRGGTQTSLQKIVKDEVAKALKEDLAAVLAEERERFREAVRTTAAALLADDATRRR